MRLQELQNSILTSSGHDRSDEFLSPQSLITSLHLSTKESYVLRLLNVTTVEDFLNLDLLNLQLPKGFGSQTYLLLTKSKKRIRQKFSTDLPLPEPVSFEEQFVFSIPLKPSALSFLRFWIEGV